MFLKISVKLESALTAEAPLAEGERLEEQLNIEIMYKIHGSPFMALCELGFVMDQYT
jgi:hypothetical protein